jgi:iron complex outermembrane receptor protein
LGLTDDKRALGVAEWNVNLGAEVDVSAVPGLTFTGRFIHTGDSYIDLANTQRVPSWNRLDIGARYLTKINDKTIVLRTWINNVTDEEYWMSGGRNLFVVAEPRTWRVSATLNF